MTHSCKDNHGDIRAKIRQPFSMRVDATKRASIKGRLKGVAKLRSKLAVVYGGFVEEVFGSTFGSSESTNRGLDPKPQFLAKTIKIKNSLKLKSTPLQIKRAITNISDILFDIESQNYIDYGVSAIPESLYVPLNANNSTKVYSKGPMVEWNLRTDRKDHSKNIEFTSRANKPISNFSVKISVNGKIKSKYFEKLHGHFDKILDIDNFIATDKLYPIKDIITEKNGVSFVTEREDSSGVYRSIDEGTHVGNIVQNNSEGYIVSDDLFSYITPSSIYSEGEFTYKCEVSPPQITPLDSFFFMRAAAPITNHETDIPPTYDISNIRLEDPSGNLIAKYKDFKITGQQDYEKQNHFHYVTYVSEPEQNLARLDTYHPEYPVLGEDSGYTLSLDIKGYCKYTPFSEDDFNKGFEHHCNLDSRFVPAGPNDYLSIDGAPISTQSNDYRIRPTNGLRISAIEIDNRGLGSGIISDGKLPLHLETVKTGTLLERTLRPTRVLSTDYSNNIYPTNTTNIWKTSPDIDGNIYYSNNKDSRSVRELSERLNNYFIEGHVTLHETQPVQDSGKLQLLFEHKTPVSVLEPVGGDFNFGNNSWSKADYELIYSDDSAFEVEEIYLSIVARKAPNTPDFPIDVVGYSDDKVLVQTDQVGGFLQNTNGKTGSIPNVSGFLNIDELGLSSETISDKFAYYDQDITDSPAGDHYIIDNTVVVDSTEFKQYTIPLSIYDKIPELGQPQKFTNSKFFESLYVDIYPIPSGASFQGADLVIKYKPASSLQMFTLGYETKKLWNTDTRIHPEKFYLSQDHYANKLFTDSTYLSQIDNIPHAYQVYEDTLKTNYSRRWRGSSGSVFGGPFDATEFDFSFENPQFNQPFLLGYYDFHNIDNDAVYSSIGATQYSGVFNSNLESSIIENRGMRFQSDSLFSSQHNTSYKSIDWTYGGSEIEGQIIDSFDKAVRVSGVDGYINFGNVPTASGFSLYTRFSPDVTVSGVGYNLWATGVLASKWDNGQDLEYALHYDDGHLTASARDNAGQIISIKDAYDYRNYMFPMSALVTYNANGDNKMRLYTYSERGNTSNPLDWQKLRGESSPFVLHSGNSDLTLGYSSGSGVGFNAFVSEIGLSHTPWSGGIEGSLSSDDLSVGRGIIGSSENVSYQVDSVDSFFAGHSLSFGFNESDNNPLWRFVDEDTDSWQLGAFKYCDFNLDFDVMKLRVGRDYIYHKFYNNGLEYQDIIDLNLPTSLAHASGLAYHSQVENDMLRFHLGGLENRYFSAPPRLSKRFPRGYVVDGDAFRINTVVQHDCDSDILWPDGNKGAKLIVSLYAPSKESELFPTENYGLVNRQSHYLNPEDCWNKITTELTISDIKDSESEPWSYFNRDVLDQELSERYFARDVDQMFVQYDLVYPSGTYSWSEIKIHSLDVSLKEALLEEEKISDELWIYASGEAYREETIDLYTDAYGIEEDTMWLWASGAAFIEDSGKMPIFTSGCYSESSDLNLYTIQIGSIGTGGEENFGDMFGSAPDKFPLYVRCSPEYTNASVDLVVDSFAPDAVNISSTLSLNVYDFSGDTKSSSISTFAYCEDVIFENLIDSVQGSMGMITRGPEFVTFNSDASLPLLSLGRPIEDTLFANFGMNTYNKKPLGQVGTYLESYSWNGTNYGLPISPNDEKYTSVSSLDEIRGVNTVCYGGCESSAFLKCTEQPLETHDVTWYSPECVDGGVIRSFTTYTNSSVPAFGSLTETYKNHYYGIRKFTNLIPKAPYSVLVIGETGDAEILEVPREMSEWEYGTSSLQPGETVPEVAYSGLKLTAENILPSGGFGHGLTAHKDMLMVGHPQEDLTLGANDFYNDDDSNYVLKNSGKIYVYKKDPEPSGADWTNQDDKAKFILQQQLVLPTGFRRDAYSSTFKTFPGVDNSFRAEVKQWYNLGEGRELGHSLDCASREDKDVLIAGGPGTMWSRRFSPVEPYPVPIGMIIFNNELVSDPPGKTWSSILEELQDRDILFRYFCDPPVVFDIKIILLEPVLGGDVDQESSLDFQYPQPNFITKHKVHRHYSYRVETQEYKDRDDLMFNELVDIFQTTFPLTENVIHSGLPPLLGIYVDDSRSLGTQAVGYYDNGLRTGALNKFIDYYKQYTYDNGVLNAPIYGSEAAEGYVQVTSAIDEDWIAQSVKCLKNLTDIPTLNQNNAFRLLGSDLGKFNNDDSEFNLLPPSGGAVFVFEKDKDENNFELVQYIDSPTTYNDDFSDRFGHDVAISDDGKTLVIGSPYADSAVQVWQYNNNYENTLDNYIQNVYISYLSTEYAREVSDATFGEAFNLYKEWQEKSTDTIFTKNLKQELWDKSSESLRFRFIENYSIKPYRLNKEITYSQLHGASDSQGDEESTRGGWSQLYNNIPTSRMGYSVDTNEDGSLVAIGCPTDSMGERDSTITWFRYDQKSTQETNYGGENWQWQNYVNAGAVRLLESRDYYPHNSKVVEFYAFGNLHESLAEPEDAEYFLPSMSGMFSGMGYDFRRTVYNEELSIPQDAGLAFIITPEISFQSDEVINNIKEWLAYGDRNLVLVGNDPIYEAGGAYNYSNNIINYILEKLEIKMRIYPARDAEESLVEPSTDLYYNIRQSTVPEKTMSPIGQFKGLKLKGFGVGDIRFFDDFASDLYQCTETTKPPTDSFSLIGITPKKNYRDLHSRCELPIITEGDLRAKYWDQCEYRPCKGNVLWINYQHNLAMLYGTHKTEDWNCTACDEVVVPTPHSNNRENSEPIPMFAAYEQLTKTIVVPPVPESIQERERIIGYNIAGETTYNFPTKNVAPYSGIAFMWSEASGNFDSLVYNLNNVQSNSAWFNPTEYDGKDAVLQAKLSSSINSFEEFYSVEPEINFVVEEKLSDNNGSSVVLIAGTATERTDVLLSSEGDINLNLYFNILAKNEYGESKVAQIGGFTQRETYKSGFKDSGIQSSMTSLNIDMSSVNVSLDDLRMSGNAYDVGWIANTDQMPSSSDILRLKEFLALGNKKLVITYGKNPLGEANEVSSEDESSLDQHYIKSANVAAYICEQLGVSMRPLFLDGQNRYASLRDARGSGGLNNMSVYGSVLEGFDSASDFIVGGKVQDFTINIDCVVIGGQRYCTGYFHDIIPIKLNGATKLAAFKKSIQDTRSASNIEPQLRTGITKVSFSVPEKEEHHDDFNLFRLYFSAHNDTALESEPFDIYISNCSRNVSLENQDSGGSYTIEDYGDDGSFSETTISLGATISLSPSVPTKTVDIQVPTDVEQIELFVHRNQTYRKADIGSEQDLSNNRTIKLFAVSGVRIPVNQKYIETKTPITEKYFVTVPGSPEYSYQQDYLREISHPSQQYCEQASPGSEICAEEPILGYGAGAGDIEDGPVVIAQEVYHQAGYFVGRNKSRVTIISDPSIIQGPTIKAEGSDSANRDLAFFLSSLYPHTNFPSPEAGRQYPDFYKIISPERSSPSRLINAYPDNDGLNYRFGGYESNSLSATSYSDTEGKKQILPTPPQDFVRQPFDSMLPIDEVVDIGKFRKLPPPLQSSTVDAMRKAGQYEAIDQLYEDWYVNNFEVVQAHYSSKSKFHDTVDGVVYKDAGYQERIPPLMRATGKDHLDFNFFGSGYPGDLFGYKVTIYDDKIYVGAPFTPYNTTNITKWDDVVSNSLNGPTYGTEVGFNGGAGAVYILEKDTSKSNGAGSTSLEITTGLPWDCVQKIRPEQLSVGFSGINPEQASGIYGNHNYTNEFLQLNSYKSDMFGYDIAIDSDILAISAPNHSFDIFFEHTPSEFIRKEFNNQFDISTVIPHDLGFASERVDFISSGVSILNHGSVFTYENRIADWGTKEQTWDEIHKISTLGSGTRIQNSQENIMFGSNISLSRAKRNDGDYILGISAPVEKISGNDKAGSVFAYDGMLRKLRPSFPHPDTYISGRVYGDGDLEIESTVFNISNGITPNKQFFQRGRVVANAEGEIFIEVSGQDKLDKGYVTHRPYIKAVRGSYLFGRPIENDMNLFTDAYRLPESGSLPLLSLGPERDSVYNKADLYCYSAVQDSGIINLYASGVPSDYYGSYQTVVDQHSENDVDKLNDINLHSTMSLVARGGPKRASKRR